jgi:hypothetical protein
VVQEHVKKVCYHGKPLDPDLIATNLDTLVGYIVTSMHPMSYTDLLAANVAKLEGRWGAAGFQREAGA